MKEHIESIIDTICQMSSAASDIIAEHMDGNDSFSKIKHYLGHYCGDSDPQRLILNNETLNNGRNYIITAQDGYYIAIELLDINLEPIRELAEQLDEQHLQAEAELIWNVYYFVKEIIQWADGKTYATQEQYFEKPVKKEHSRNASISRDEFLALFDEKKTNKNKANLLLNHILEVSKERNVHTYYGALIQECISWFKYNEQDLSNLLRIFLDVAGLDPNLATNVRRTKLGKKAKERAKEKIDEITSARKRN